MTSLVLKAQSPCEIFCRHCTILGLGVTSKNENVKQIRVIFFCLNFKCKLSWRRGFIFHHILQIYLNMCPIFQQVCECRLQKNATPLTVNKLQINVNRNIKIYLKLTLQNFDNNQTLGN